MKIRFIFLLLVLLQFSLNRLGAQSLQNENLGLPLKQDRSVLFGKDIILNNKSYQDQRFNALCSSYNGWLYGIYSHLTSDTNSWTIMRSIDNGMTWNVFFTGSSPFTYSRTTSFSIIACGNELVNLKVFVSFIVTFSSVLETRFAVERFNGQTGGFEDIMLSEDGPVNSTYKNGSIASDYQSPLISGTPYSLGILYTRSSLYPNDFHDSLIYLSSSNGGMSLNNRKVVAVAKDFSKRFGKVALTYGYCPASSSGRYFATWEEKESDNASVGHIFTSHTNPDITSQFTDPICLDSLDASFISLCRNPRIACQVNNVNNDSANLSEVVLFEKFIPGSGTYDLKGCYNLQAASSSHFRKLNIAVTADNEIQPDITFNSFDNNFYVTYYDSTTQKLPLLANNFNLNTPDLWSIISDGYNDSTNLIAPHPKIAINPAQHECANLWIAERDNGNGVAMFDAPYSTYTGSSEKNMERDNLMLKIFPNPASEFAILEFELPRNENVKVDILSSMGQSLANITYLSCTSGKHQVKIGLTNYSSGMYIIKVSVGESFYSRKLFIDK